MGGGVSVTNIELQYQSMENNPFRILIGYTVLPQNATNKTLSFEAIYTSSNGNIENGTVVDNGDDTITATFGMWRNYSSTYKVSVFTTDGSNICKVFTLTSAGWEIN